MAGYKIYVDMLLLDNMVMNLLILWTTEKLSKKRTTNFRLISGAFIGAVYAILVFMPVLVVLDSIAMKLVLSLIIVLISFPIKSMIEYFKVLGVFYLVTFAFGGAALGLFYFTNTGTVLSNGVFYIHEFPYKLLILSCVIVCVIFKYCWAYIKNRITKEAFLIEISICFDNRYKQLRALLDTGNSLYDPISNLPVIVIEYGIISDVLPEDIKNIYKRSIQGNLEEITKIISNSKWMWRFRMIPFTSLGAENGLLLGFKPDSIIINEGEKAVLKKDVIIGIYDKKLSKDGEYNGLVHPEILEAY